MVDTEFARDLDVPKIPASVVAEAILTGLARNRDEIRVARVRQLVPVARLVPRLGDRIVQRALQPRGLESD